MHLPENPEASALQPISGKEGYAPYSDYKDSGIEWLGEIPAHWEAKRLKSLVKNVTSKAPSLEKQDTYIALENIQSWTGRASPSQYEGAPDNQVKHFQSGDILFGKLRPYLAKVARPQQNGICSSELLVLRPMTGLCGPFLEQRFLSKDVIDLIDSSTFGAKMPRAEWEFIGKTRIAFPPDIEEQKTIATFLDRETAKIDTLIDKQEQLIDLLKERRTALISHAVTKGLNPDVPMKDSGIEWLGEIPAHWEAKRLKSLVKNVTSKAPSLEKQDTYIALENIQSWTGRASPSQYEGAPDNQVKHFQSGDILFGKLRPYLAKVARPQQNGICSSELLVLRPMTGLCGPFLEQRFLSKDVIDLIDSSTFGAKMPRAEWEFIGKTRIAFPPDIEEQKTIATFLDRETAKIDTLISKIYQAIELQKESRSALITAAVTGKMDVRQVSISSA